MGMRTRRRRSRLLRRALAIACVSAALTGICALHGASVAADHGSTYAKALADDAIDLDDDADDSAAFALEAAQEEAARLLDAFGGDGNFLADDDDELGGDTDGDSDSDSVASAEGVEEGHADYEAAKDASARRVPIKLHRSDATVEDEDADADMDASTSAPIHPDGAADTSDIADVAADDAEEVESVELSDTARAVADEDTQHENSQRAVEEEESAREKNTGAISKRVGAVFLKVRGVIFPTPDAEDSGARFKATTAHAVKVSVSDSALPLLDIHGNLGDAPAISSDSAAPPAVEELFPLAESSRDPVEAQQEHANELEDATDSEYDSSDEDVVVAVDIQSEGDTSSVVDSVKEPLSVETQVGADDDGAVDEEEKEAGEAIAAAVVSELCSTTDSASDADSCQFQLLENIIEYEFSTEDAFKEPPAAESAVSFEEVVMELATAAEQIVVALREGRLPHAPAIFASARTKARAKLDACVKAVVDPATSAMLTLHELLAVAETRLGAWLEILLRHLQTLYAYLARTLGVWSHHASAAYRQISEWGWQVWSTQEAVRVLGHNLVGLALLLPCGLLFFSLYGVVAAIPTFLCAYFLTFDDVTRAQLKIFSSVLLLLVVYHARVLAWFWIVLSAALGYYYWSGHVVISVKFK